MEPFKEREELKMLSGKFSRKISGNERLVGSKRIIERVLVVVVVVVVMKGGIIKRHIRV